MQVAMDGATLVVKNFFGEKIPRKVQLGKDIQVKVQGDKIIVSGADIDKVGETASRIEQLCRITNRDRRVFQDGIFLIEKNGKAI
jgi:large subunit ribosomal protein L6